MNNESEPDVFDDQTELLNVLQLQICNETAWSEMHIGTRGTKALRVSTLFSVIGLPGWQRLDISPESESLRARDFRLARRNLELLVGAASVATAAVTAAMLDMLLMSSK